MTMARISVSDARARMQSRQALLVCAYEDEAKCEKVKLDGSISLHEFQSRAPALPNNREIIFYCA